MTLAKNKPGLVAAISDAHESFHRAIKDLADADLNTSGVEAEWSVKDVAAHLEFWQRRAIFYLECISSGWDQNKDRWKGDSIDNLNALNFQTNHARLVADVMASLQEAETSIQHLLDMASEDDIFTSNKFAWVHGRALAGPIANETFEHYREHLPPLWAWRIGKLHADRKTRDSLIDRIELAHANIDSILINLSAKKILLPGVEEHWSVKDILAHLVYWEQKIANQLATLRSGGTPALFTESEGDVNAQVYQENRDRPLDDILSDLSVSRQQVIGEITHLAPETLDGVFPWADGEENWRLWDYIASETFRHFEDHGGKISVWMAANNIQS